MRRAIGVDDPQISMPRNATHPLDCDDIDALAKTTPHRHDAGEACIQSTNHAVARKWQHAAAREIAALRAR
jgi:hypothetical protein